MGKYNILIPTEKGEIAVDSKQVIYVEADIHQVQVVLIDDQRIPVRLSMNEMEYSLSKRGFFRFNRKYLVNLRYVEVVFPYNASKVVLENGKEIFVNHNKKDELFESLKEVYDLHELV